MSIQNGDREKLMQLERRVDNLDQQATVVAHLQRDVAVIFERVTGLVSALSRIERGMAEDREEMRAEYDSVKAAMLAREHQVEARAREDREGGRAWRVAALTVAGGILAAMVGALVAVLTGGLG